MTIIIGILQSVFSSFGMILTKKLVQNKKIGNNWQTFFARITHIIGIGVLIGLFGILDFNVPKEEVTIFNTLLLLGGTTLLYITYPLRRSAYANEKMSVLQPFQMLFQVFPVILGFIFIATERANIVTFIMSITASMIVIGASIDYKNFKINKYCLMVLASSIIKSVQVFATVYFLTILSASSFYILETGLVIIFSIVLIVLKKELPELKLIDKKYLNLQFLTSLVALVGIIMALTLYKDAGIVFTSLITLLYLIFIYIFGYLILKEIPSRKDVIITILVSICIIIGMWFKN